MSRATRIVTFGNCQAEGLKRLLDRALPAGFRIEFFSNNWRTGAMRPASDILEAIAEADVVCFQPLKSSHGDLAEDNLRATIGGECVSFPYLFNAGISGLAQTVRPQQKAAQDARSPTFADCLGLDVLEHGLVYGEEAIVQRLQRGATPQSVISSFEEGEIDFRLPQRFAASVSELERRESSTQIKLAGFIRDVHTRERLFHMPSHPTTALFLELMRQLARIAGLPLDLDRVRELEDDDAAGLGRGMSPVSPADVAAMGYEFAPDRAWKNRGTRLINAVVAKFRAARELGLEPAETLNPADIHLERITLPAEGPGLATSVPMD